MNKMDDTGRLLCKYVSDLFEYSTKQKDCSSKVFVKSFVYSSIQKRINKKDFLLDSIDVPMAYSIIKNEKNMTRGKEVYPSYVMAWIGYIMKYFCYVTGISEVTFYQKIKPEDLYKMYEAYHSLDNDLVVKRLSEDKNINIELNNVELLKRIYGNI